jgi:hypothetical protein
LPSSGNSEDCVFPKESDHVIHGTIEHEILYEGGVDRDQVVAGAKEFVRRVLGP